MLTTDQVANLQSRLTSFNPDFSISDIRDLIDTIIELRAGHQDQLDQPAPTPGITPAQLVEARQKVTEHYAKDPLLSDHDRTIALQAVGTIVSLLSPAPEAV